MRTDLLTLGICASFVVSAEASQRCGALDDGRCGVPVAESGPVPPGPIPNPVVTRSSAGEYCGGDATGGEAAAGAPHRRSSRGVEQWQLVGLITQRSEVRILPPLPIRRRSRPGTAALLCLARRRSSACATLQRSCSFRRCAPGVTSEGHGYVSAAFQASRRSSHCPGSVVGAACRWFRVDAGARHCIRRWSAQ